MAAPQSSKSPERQLWAVCPRFTEGTLVPEWFHREDDAREWQNEMVAPATIVGDEEILPPDPDSGFDYARIVRPIVPIRWSYRWDAGGNEWIVIERTDGKPISNGVGAFRRRKDGLSSISPNELPRGYLQETRRCERGWWDLVPINWIDEQMGDPYRGKRFRDFLQLDKVSSLQATNIKADLEEIFEERYPDVACDLGNDWQFDRLQACAKKRRGHMFRGRVIQSLPHQLVMIAYDLETSLFKFHPDLPSQALAAFWTSWRAWRHLASCCSKILEELLQQDRSAVLLHGAGEAMAIQFVCRQLWAYAQEARDWKATADRHARKAPAQLLTEYKVSKRIRTHELVAEDLGLERSVYFDLKAGKRVSEETYIKAALRIGCSPCDLRTNRAD